MSNDQDKTMTTQGEEELAIRSGVEAVGPILEETDVSLEIAHASLSNVMERNVQMTKMISDMMQNLLTTNVKLVCNFKPKRSGRVDMELMIMNNTDFPINSVTGQVRFVHDDQDIGAIFEQDSIFKSPCHISSKSNHSETTQFDLSKSETLTRYNGGVQISFPHPLTNNPINIKSLFAIYILDQLSKRIVDKSESIKFATHSFIVGFLREIMEIHPIKGIEIGLCIELKSIKNHKIIMEIIRISGDLTMVEVELSGESKEEELLAKEVLNELINIQ